MKWSKWKEELAFPVALLYFFSGLIKHVGLQSCLQHYIHFKGTQIHTQKEKLCLHLLSKSTKEATEGEYLPQYGMSFPGILIKVEVDVHVLCEKKGAIFKKGNWFMQKGWLSVKSIWQNTMQNSLF